MLYGTTMELWMFDWLGLYSLGEFDIHKEFNKFISAIAGYFIINIDKPGLDTFSKQKDENQFIFIIIRSLKS